MSLLIGFLTFILVMNCLFLILLVLVQLPKKDAGAGTAFGGGATDALFGAGTGNVLTKLTKYSAGVFLGLSLLLSVLNISAHTRSGEGLKRELEKKARVPAPAVPDSVKLPAGFSNTNQSPGTSGIGQLNIIVPTNPPPDAPKK